MKRYLARRPIVSTVVFIVTCVGSIWLFKKQLLDAPPVMVPTPPVVFVSSKFTRIGNVPTADGPRYELQFINAQEGWLAKGKHLWQTQNGGKTWELVHQIQPSSREAFARLQFVNSTQGWATFLNYGDLYKTGDGGRTWSRVATPMDDAYGSLWTFHLEPNAGSGWIAGGIFQPMKRGEGCMNNARGSLANTCLNGALFRTDDGGASWHEQKIPQNAGRFMSITFTNPDHAWVAGDAGVFQTTNRGRTWSSGEFRRECEDYYQLQDMDPVSTSFVDHKTGWLEFSSGLIAKTTDGGKTWCDLFEPETLWRFDPKYVGPTQMFDSIHFTDANYGLGLGYDRRVYQTFDGGAKWQLEGSGAGFETIVFYDNANGWAISTEHELYRVRLEEAARNLIAAREEPRQLIDIFSDEDISYRGYEVKKLMQKVRDETNREIDVSYAVLTKNKRRLLKFDGMYFGAGNNTEFGLFDLLGQKSQQIIVSQTVPRGGRHWVVSVSPDVRVLFDSWDFDVGREEFYVIDIDKDGVYEIVLPVTAFYSMHDKMYIGEIPLPEIIFKYNAKARRYLPANYRFADYALHGINRDMYNLRNDDSNYLSRRLDILLRYIYARQAPDGWATFASTYQRPDRKEITERIRSVLKKNAVYNYLYR